MNSPDDKMLSVLSRGYGTWDGIAKGEPVEKDNVSIWVFDKRLFCCYISDLLTLKDTRLFME